MAVSLKKGENVSLSKTDPNLKNVLIGLGWDARASDGVDFDLDASLFMVGENGKVQKYKLRERGVTPTAWERPGAGVRKAKG